MSMLVSISWSSHFRGLRRFSRMFQDLSTFFGTDLVRLSSSEEYHIWCGELSNTTISSVCQGKNRGMRTLRRRRSQAVPLLIGAKAAPSFKDRLQWPSRVEARVEPENIELVFACPMQAGCVVCTEFSIGGRDGLRDRAAVHRD